MARSSLRRVWIDDENSGLSIHGPQLNIPRQAGHSSGLALAVRVLHAVLDHDLPIDNDIVNPPELMRLRERCPVPYHRRIKIVMSAAPAGQYADH